MDGWMDVSEVEDQSKIESTRSSLSLSSFMSYELPGSRPMLSFAAASKPPPPFPPHLLPTNSAKSHATTEVSSGHTISCGAAKEGRGT